MLYFSPAGGAGGGLSDIISTIFSSQFSKKSYIGVEVLTDQNNSNSVIEPYNLVLSSSSMLENFDMHIAMSNENIGKIL
jgi:hypothetical protein